MARLHPALRRHAWNPLFWWNVLRCGDAWMACERCGYLNECVRYGEAVQQNYDALRETARKYRAAMPDIPDRIKGPEDKRVCIHCCAELREVHGDHASFGSPSLIGGAS